MARSHAFDHEWPAGARACCRISRQPVYTSPDWCWISPQRHYGIRIERIGDRIISLKPWGHISLDHIRRGWAIFQKALADAPPDRGPFIVIDDHSRIDGATLNARRYIVQQLQHLSNWEAYIVYGTPSVLKPGLNLARRMNLFSFQIQVVADYDEGMRLAQEWQVRQRQRNPHGLNRVGSDAPSESADVALAVGVLDVVDADQSTDPRELALQDYAQKLLRHIGQLSLNRYGVLAAHDARSSEHPFRSVYDALGMIHADMIRILARNQRNQLRLQEQEQALLEKNAALAEAQTTLKILLRNRQEERRKQTVRIGQRFRDILLPILEGLVDTELTPGQQRQSEFIRDIICNISHAFNFNPMSNTLKLTPRETLTAYLVARGCTTCEAAAVMKISPRTIERYRAGLRKKTGLAGTGLPLAPWLSRHCDGGLSSGPDPP